MQRLIVLLIVCVAAAAQVVITPNPGDPLPLNKTLPKACAATPGDTAGVYRSQCQTSGGVIYSCNNASGCTVAADWVSQGGTATALGFDAVTNGSNTQAAMTVGTGASLAPTGTGAISANQINGTALSGLATGILKNTTTTGVPSIAVAADVPAAGTSGQVIFNNGSGAYAGDDGLAFNSATDALGVKGSITTGVAGGNNGSINLLGSTSGTANITTNSTGAAIVFDKPLATNGSLTVGQASTATGSVLFNGTTSGTVTLKSADAAGTWSLTLPANDGDNGQVLTTDGNGVTSWSTAGGGAPAFSAITGATNTTAAMVVGTGASLVTTGSGTITATAVPWSGLTGATNTTAAMLVGTGASLGPTGSGTITATAMPWSGLSAPGANLTINNSTYTTDFTGTGRFTLPGAIGIGTGANAPTTEVEVDSTSTSSPRGIMSAQFNTGADGARLHLRKARGTRASPTVITTGDTLGRLVGSGYEGSNYLEMASIDFVSSGTIASTRVPTEIQFYTATNAAPSVLTKRMTIDNGGNVLIGSANTSSTPFMRLDLNVGDMAGSNGEVIRIPSTATAAAEKRIAFYSVAYTKPQAFIGSSIEAGDTSKGYLALGGATGSALAESMRINSLGNVLIGGTTDGNYRLDVQKSGSSGTARFYDQTATTGATRVQISLGAADSAATVTLTNAGTIKAAGYQSSDGSAGVTVTTCTSFKNGLCVAGT